MHEPYEVFNSDPTILPRYTLAHNKEYFKILFDLQDLSDELAILAFDFLGTIATNPEMYRQMLYAASEDKKEYNWHLLFDENNIYK